MTTLANRDINVIIYILLDRSIRRFSTGTILSRLRMGMGISDAERRPVVPS